jgi:hypothetical protein
MEFAQKTYLSLEISSRWETSTVRIVTIHGRGEILGGRELLIIGRDFAISKRLSSEFLMVLIDALRWALPHETMARVSK